MDILYVTRLRRRLEIGSIVCVRGSTPNAIVITVGRRLSATASPEEMRRPHAFFAVIQGFASEDVELVTIGEISGNPIRRPARIRVRIYSCSSRRARH